MPAANLPSPSKLSMRFKAARQYENAPLALMTVPTSSSPARIAAQDRVGEQVGRIAVRVLEHAQKELPPDEPARGEEDLSEAVLDVARSSLSPR